MSVQSGGLLARVQSLYDRSLFLDAYALVREAWFSRAWAESASLEELILAARLAGRLGGRTRMRWLHRLANSRFPGHPLVRTYGRWVSRRSRSILHELVDLEARPSLDSGDPRTDAIWYAESAFFWSMVRDFRQAHLLLDRAREQAGDDPWFHCMEGSVLLAEERWEEAAEAALRAWRLSPLRPAAADLVVRSYSRLGRGDEAVELLRPCAEGQSFESLYMLLWLMAGRAERMNSAGGHELADQAWAWSSRLEELAPLGDRSVRYQLAACRFDLAMVRGDHEAMKAQARTVPFPVYREVAEHLVRGDGQGAILLDYACVFQKGPQCLPTSIAAVAASFGRKIDAQELARSITYSGTPVWRALAWLREQGYHARLLLLTPENCRLLLRRGVPFVYTIEYALDVSHATAAVGLDEPAGILIYHDPSSERMGRVLVDRIAEQEAPLGPLAMAFVPGDRASLLEDIPTSDAEIAEFCCRYWQAVATGELMGAGAVLDEMAHSYTGTTAVRALRASWQTLAGDVLAGVAELERLVGENPASLVLHRLLLNAVNRTRHVARIRQVMSEIVLRGRLPGIRQDEPWRYPPAPCVCQYADMISQAQEGAPEAQKRLYDLLRRMPTYAQAFHVLGDIHLRAFRPQEAVLPCRLASLLDEYDEHLARTVYDACHIVGRTQEGLDFLRARVDRLGNLVEGGGPWITLIEAMEEAGRSDQALELARQAQEARAAQDAALAAYLVGFWMQIGQWEQAGQALERVRQLGSPLVYLPAAVSYHRQCGQWERALELAERWVAQSPNSSEAWEALVLLRANRETLPAMLALTRQQMEAHPNDESFEFLHYGLLRQCGQEEQALAWIRRRLDQNHEDAWAWRELAHLLLDKAEGLAGEARAAVVAELRTAAGRAVKLSPHDPATLAVRARLAILQGRREQAIRDTLEALRLAPSMDVGYLFVWQHMADQPLDQQQEMLGQLRERLLLIAGPLRAARALVMAVAERLGSQEAEAFIAHLRSAREEDADLIEAQAALLLSYGQGRRDAGKAIQILQPAVDRYPRHFELRVTLADAHGVLLDEPARRAVLEEALRWRPLHGGVRSALAELLAARNAQRASSAGNGGKRPDAMQAQGDPSNALAGTRAAPKAKSTAVEPQEPRPIEPALSLLREGVAMFPRDVMVRFTLCRLLWQDNQRDACIQSLREAVAVVSEDVFLRRQLAGRLVEMGRGQEAMQVVREAMAILPDSCVLYHLQAEVLINDPLAADVEKAAAALRKALELNCRYWEAADQLAWLLTRRRRYDQAEQVVRDILPLLSDPSAALGRLAWIGWERGQREQALADLVALLKRHPEYRMGWYLVMDWLEELQDFSQAEGILKVVPGPIRSDPDLAARRLRLLRSQLTSEQMDPLWEEVITDFPTNLELYCMRFDQLADHLQWKQARAVLERALAHCEPSDHLRVREVRLLVAENKDKQAVKEGFELICTARDEGPQVAVWEYLVQGRLQVRAVSRVLERLSDGLPVGATALQRMLAVMAEYCAKIPMTCKNQKLNLVEALEAMAGWLDKAAWDAGCACLGAVLETIADYHPSFVRTYWHQNASRCKKQRTLWQVVAYWMTNRNDRQVREWIGDWRERQGVAMFVVSYYRHSFGAGPIPAREMEACLSHSLDALERLPHDGTAQFHAVTACDCLLRLGREEEFIALAGRFAELLAVREERLWMPPYFQASHTGQCLLDLAKMLQSDDRQQAALAFLRLRNRPRDAFVYAYARQRLKRWFTWWQRINLWLLGGY